MEAPRNGLRVFISYARSDCSAFADDLMAGLEAAGFDPFLDRHDIAAGEAWEARLGNLLQQADTVVYVISPASVGSDRCAWEIERAAQLSKRVIPVVAIEVDEASTPEKLRRLNYIFFSAGHSFGVALRQLSEALRTDIDWIREHTRFAELAARWRDRNKAEELLLRGEELQRAKNWLAGWKPGSPEVTEHHRAFIHESEAAENNRNSEERQRLEKLAALQRSRARAIVIAGILVVAMIAVMLGLGFRISNMQSDYEALLADFELAKQANAADANARVEERESVQQGAEVIAETAEPPAAQTPQAPMTTQRALPDAEREARINLGWDIDVFACEGVAGADQRARSVYDALLAERERQLNSPRAQGFSIGRVRVRTLSATTNARPGYQVSADEVRSEDSERNEAEAVVRLISSHGDFSIRSTRSRTPYYSSVFVCAAR